MLDAGREQRYVQNRMKLGTVICIWRKKGGREEKEKKEGKKEKGRKRKKGFDIQRELRNELSMQISLIGLDKVDKED